MSQLFRSAHFATPEAIDTRLHRAVQPETLNLNESNTVWMDLNFPIVIRTTGANIPTMEPFIGNILAPQWQPNDYVNCEGQEMPHNWKEGSVLYWHVHLYTNGQEAVDKFLAFEVELAIAAVNGVLTELTKVVSGDLTIPADTPTKTMKLLSLGTTNLASYTIGSQIYARLKRVTATGTAPAANPWIPQLQAHIELDGLGSREITAK